MQTQKARKNRLISHSTPENHRITPRNAQKITPNHAPSEGNDIPFSRRIRLQAPRTSVNSCLETNPAAQKTCFAPSNRQEVCKTWGLVHFSAKRRILPGNDCPKTWTCPLRRCCSNRGADCQSAACRQPARSPNPKSKINLLLPRRTRVDKLVGLSGDVRLISHLGSGIWRWNLRCKTPLSF